MRAMVLPELPAGRGPARVVAWLAQPGDDLAAGEALVVVVNDRVEVALPAAHAGQLGEILAPAGASVAAGDRLALIRHARPARLPVRATPLARRIAQALGVDLALVAGSAPDGRVTARDVRAAAPAAARGPAEHPGRPPAPGPRVRAPVAWSVMELRAELLLARCERPWANGPLQPVELTPLICVAAAVVAALSEHRRAGGWWAGDGIAVRPDIHLALGSHARHHGPDLGMVQIAAAQDLSLRGIARAATRGERLQPGGASRATFTIVASEAALHHNQPPDALPQIMLGPATSRPVLDAHGAGERIAIGQVATLAFAYDARVLTYAEADSFLAAVVWRLERFMLR